MQDELLSKSDFLKALGDPSETIVNRALARLEGRQGASRQPVPDRYDARAKRYPSSWVDEVRKEIEAILAGK